MGGDEEARLQALLAQATATIAEKDRLVELLQTQIRRGGPAGLASAAQSLQGSQMAAERDALRRELEEVYRANEELQALSEQVMSFQDQEIQQLQQSQKLKR